MKVRVLCVAVVFGCGCIATPTTARAQASMRDSAFKLFDLGRHLESLPLLEQLAVSMPSDALVLEHLGMVLLQTSRTDGDPAVRKKIRARVHVLFAKALSLGLKDVTVSTLLQAIPEDGGSDAVFSDNKGVNDAMNDAENAFGKEDFRTALTFYQKALSLDPTMYNAAVFSGDSYMRLQQLDSAYIWYAMATSINPDRETAWRYWSDVLSKHKQFDDSRDKAIEAMVAEPFNRMARQAIVSWAQTSRTSLAFPRVILPVQDTSTTHTPAWTAYDSVRREWKGSLGKLSVMFVAQYPNDRAYRHSVGEEKAALQAAYKAGNDDPATINLKRLDDAGALEAYIFFTRADAGIASEYDAYRRGHRDILKKFWTEYVIGARYEK